MKQSIEERKKKIVAKYGANDEALLKLELEALVLQAEIEQLKKGIK